jgi:hypothetical protein
MQGWDEELRTFLFKEGDIAEHHDDDNHDDEKPSSGGGLGIGKIK